MPCSIFDCTERGSDKIVWQDHPSFASIKSRTRSLAQPIFLGSNSHQLVTRGLYSPSCGHLNRSAICAAKTGSALVTFATDINEPAFHNIQPRHDIRPRIHLYLKRVVLAAS